MCSLQESKNPEITIPDILLNVFLAIAVDNLADADALEDGPPEGEGAEVANSASSLRIMISSQIYNIIFSHTFSWK